MKLTDRSNVKRLIREFCYVLLYYSQDTAAYLIELSDSVKKLKIQCFAIEVMIL